MRMLSQPLLTYPAQVVSDLVPFILLDSLKAIDANRKTQVVEYLQVL